MIMDIKELYKRYEANPIITTDSRNCPPGSIFIALKGESFDGNRFAKAALEKGCSYAIIDNKAYGDPTDERIILVDDALLTYKQLAREHRRRFPIPVIGITGTNGKTTSKELIAAVLSKKYNVLYTEGNFNNDVGVPKTLMRLTHEHEIAVIEMGASHEGDIRKLVEYAEPTCGLITNVGRAHLEGFGSFEGVKRTKGELYDYLKTNDALLFLNESNDDLVSMAKERNFERIVSYGQSTTANVQGEMTGCAPFLNFHWRSNDAEWQTVETQLVGAYNLDNMLAAVAIGLHFGVSPADICDALVTYTPSNNRSQLTQTPNNSLIVDAYNANPSSMVAAIDNFRVMEVERKMAILGDMRELGATTDEEHQKVVERLEAGDFQNVWLVGENFAKINTTYRKFQNIEEVKEELQQHPLKGFHILIKGSNGTRLFELPDFL